MLLCNSLRIFFDGLRFRVLELRFGVFFDGLGFRVLLLWCKDFVVTFRVVVQRFTM